MANFDKSQKSNHFEFRHVVFGKVVLKAWRFQKCFQVNIKHTGKEVGKGVKIGNYCVDYTAHAQRGA